MGKFAVELNSKGVQEYLKSASVQAELKRRAEAIARASGEGYEASSLVGKSRARASVITATAGAIVDNQRNNTLLRNLGAGDG